MIYLGVDPGITTGWAVYDSEQDAVPLWGEWSSGYLGLNEGLLKLLRESLPAKRLRLRWMIVERTRGGIGGDLQAEVNLGAGVVVGVGSFAGIPVVLRTNNQRRAFLGLAKTLLPTTSGHVTDALAHVLAFRASVG